MHFFGKHWGEGVAWYRSHYGGDGGFHLDATPNYLCTPNAHGRMHGLFPDARIILSLRNPVDRAFSQYNHYMQDMPESRSWDWQCPGDRFIDNLEAEIESPKPKWYGMLQRGFYIDQIEHLTAYYRRDQIHVMVLEQWATSVPAMLDGVASFLDIDSAPMQQCVSHVRDYTVMPMEREIRERLGSIYRPYNLRLFEWLGCEIPEWQ